MTFKTFIIRLRIYLYVDIFQLGLSCFQTLFTDRDCVNYQNLKISHNTPPDS